MYPTLKFSLSDLYSNLVESIMFNFVDLQSAEFNYRKPKVILGVQDFQVPQVYVFCDELVINFEER